MNIYIAHSTSFDFKKELYEPIKQSEIFKIHNIVLPHENSSSPFNSKDFFDNKCNLVIAECSYPSTGLGIELGWANDRKIHIIAIRKKGFKISKAIKSVTDLIIEYNDLNEILEEISNSIKMS